MNKFLLSAMLIILSCLAVKAQKSDIQIQVLSEKEAVIGANVYLESEQKAAITDVDGKVNFVAVADGKQTVVISYLGFETLKKTIQLPSQSTFVFQLKTNENELDEVVLQTSRSSRTVRKIPTRIEFIGSEELEEKATMNPTNISLVLRESTGIQMQQTSLSSGNSNIKIQGLDGRYTQLLRDGFPLYSGFSSGLSIMQIPPLDLQQFEIIKGSSSTLYGGGAIAGLVNMVSKTPKEEADLDIMLTQTQALGSTANVFYSKRNDKFGTTLYGSAHYQKAYDPEDDDFSNLPKTKSISFNPKIFYYPSEKTIFWLGLNGTYDDRIGGDMTKIKNGAAGIHQYTEDNISKRLSTQAVYRTQLDSVSNFNIKNSISYFDRTLKVPDFNFSGKQTNTFTEVSYERASGKTDLILGANVYSVNFDEANDAPLQRDQKELTYGLFANSIFDISENWILEAGLRTDYNVDWGFFPLPRVSLLYKNENGFSSRIGSGLGYKIPDIFTEEAESINFENVLGIDKNNLKTERSYGVNYDLNFQTRLGEIGFSANQLFYVTAIKNALLLNTTPDAFFKFENASEVILSKGAETNIKFNYKDFKWFLNYAFIDARLHYLAGNPQKPLTPKHNVGSVIMYESEDWRMGFETYFTGKQMLSNGTKTRDYTTMGFLLMRSFKWGSLFTNFENFTDRRQSRFSSLVLPTHDKPSFPEIYAPTDGFILSLGIIIKPFGNKAH